MKLSKDTINDFRCTAEHFRDSGDLDPSNPRDFARHQELDDVVNLLTNIPSRFAIELRRIELVPESNDPILNYVVKEIMQQYEIDEDPTNLETAFWEYMHVFHKFDIEDYDLTKSTFEEAIAFAIIEKGLY